MVVMKKLEQLERQLRRELFINIIESDQDDSSQNWAPRRSDAMTSSQSNVCRAENGGRRDQRLTNRLSPSTLRIPGSALGVKSTGRAVLWVANELGGVPAVGLLSEACLWRAEEWKEMSQGREEGISSIEVMQ